MASIKGAVKGLIHDQRGYNLFEMVCVIVIVALLAAILIPGMVKMIDDAKKQANVATARSLYLAAQVTATELMGEADEKTPYHIPTADDLRRLVADDGLYEGITQLTIYDDDMNGTIDGVTFTKDGDQVRLIPGGKVTINGNETPISTPSTH